MLQQENKPKQSCPLKHNSTSIFQSDNFLQQTVQEKLDSLFGDFISKPDVFNQWVKHIPKKRKREKQTVLLQTLSLFLPPFRISEVE